MRLIYLVLATLVLTGCGGEEFQDLRDFVKNSGADMRGKIPPPPSVRIYEPFAYNNDTRVADPFKPRKPESSTSGKRGENEPDFDRPKEALEEFPLESLKMVGYVFKSKVGFAVVRAPDGKLHQVRAGNYVGMNFGLITKVTDTEILIKEVVQDSTGDWSDRNSSLQLME
ncbi:MAG: pilus assembly protein PilP [Gallionellaceae bacterium CG1_02_56_997]|nr:MAG: pilus assembly protein PilP [Gallionellaceae bacterium CG1_02_56_997]PIV15160.1 MAG: pilus assembly protein PilP [Gallionellales bacterium CG03_land_8_20_14_0_80_55_15]